MPVIWRLVGGRDCGYIRDMVPPPSDGLGLARVSIPELHDAPVFYPAGTRLIWISDAGEITVIDRATAAARLARQIPVICHRRWTEARAGQEIDTCLDVMELYAFVRPARFCLPTPRGLAAQLALPRPHAGEDMAALLPRAAYALLDELAAAPDDARREAVAIATMMAASGWPWGPIILAHLGMAMPPDAPPDGRMAAVWSRLPEYTDFTATAPPGTAPILADRARERLGQMLGQGAEPRETQSDYAAALAAGFDTPDAGPTPALVLAEAGTGTGKTLGYLAPATLWAETNGAPVWISTYTRTLQHQIASELTRLYPDPNDWARKVVIRKGRENYLCLLNLEEALGQLAGAPRRGTALGLMARWAGATNDGDLTGATFPAWLTDLAGRAQTVGLADRRGECIHSACTHYNRCFVEKSMRRSRRADIVISNHALVMINAAYAPPADPEDDREGGERRRPMRYVFDEGHHLFDAADSAFSLYLSAQEAAELRSWIRGAEDGRRGRARGLKKRLDDLLADDAEALADLESALEAARALPGQGWQNGSATCRPSGRRNGSSWRFARPCMAASTMPKAPMTCRRISIRRRHRFWRRWNRSAPRWPSLRRRFTGLRHGFARYWTTGPRNLKAATARGWKVRSAGSSFAPPGRSPAGRRFSTARSRARPTALSTGCRSTGSTAPTVMSGWPGTGSTRRFPSPAWCWSRRMASP